MRLEPQISGLSPGRTARRRRLRTAGPRRSDDLDAERGMRMISYRHPKNSPGREGPNGEPLSLERAEQLARELGIHPQGMRRMMERASRAEWHPRERKLVFTFPELEPPDGG